MEDGKLDLLSFDQLVERAMAELELKVEAAINLFHLDECRWDVDQTKGEIVFSREANGAIIDARAPVQIIGSFNPEDASWLWSWANPSILEPLTAHARELRDFGEARNIAMLQSRKLSCKESDCWPLAALACMINQAEGVYRGPTGGPFVFMTFGRVQLSKRGA